MSKTACSASIVGCLEAAEQILGSDRTWRPGNLTQKQFLEEILHFDRDLPKIPELESVVSPDVAVVNRFLAEKGFRIQLDELNGSELAMASILDLAVRWITPGTRSTVGAEKYPAVRMSQGITFHRSGLTKETIARIETRSGDSVFVVMDHGENDYLGLLALAHSFERSLEPENSHAGLHLPMIDLDQEADISWIVGLSTVDKQSDWWVIDQALQQNKLRLNELGAHAESATALGAKRCVASLPVLPPLVIDKPFLIWFSRPGLELPLFVAHVTEECWKEPAAL